MLLLTKTLLVVSLATLATSAAIPIWELLTKQEKVGTGTNLCFYLVHDQKETPFCLVDILVSHVVLFTFFITFLA